MQNIDQSEAAHMPDAQLIHECWILGYTYQDYVTNCELLNRSPISKETFHSIYRNYETMSIRARMP
jgi:hypothetical protein